MAQADAPTPDHHPSWPRELLSRIEDAGINASAPPQQRWVDGWLLRTSPGAAKRARCIQAVAAGIGPLDQRLARCLRGFAEAGLPPIARLTPFSQPAGLDEALAQRGWSAFDPVSVMVAALALPPAEPLLPAGLAVEVQPAEAYARTIGALRGSSEAEIAGHAQRLALSPVPYQGYVLREAPSACAGRPGEGPAGGGLSAEPGPVLACGQIAIEDELVGLYDVYTAPASRGQGLARALCAQLLRTAHGQGARVAYLQVEVANAPARAVYRRLGFADAYAYHYRAPS